MSTEKKEEQRKRGDIWVKLGGVASQPSSSSAGEYALEQMRLCRDQVLGSFSRCLSLQAN